LSLFISLLLLPFASAFLELDANSSWMQKDLKDMQKNIAENQTLLNLLLQSVKQITASQLAPRALPPSQSQSSSSPPASDQALSSFFTVPLNPASTIAESELPAKTVMTAKAKPAESVILTEAATQEYEAEQGNEQQEEKQQQLPLEQQKEEKQQLPQSRIVEFMRTLQSSLDTLPPTSLDSEFLIKLKEILSQALTDPSEGLKHRKSEDENSESFCYHFTFHHDVLRRCLCYAIFIT
jgi:hypothetical protein